MSTAFLALVVVAGLACPAHMWWRLRRGETVCCSQPPTAEDELTALAERQRVLGEKLAAVRAAEAGGSGSYSGYAVEQ